MKLAVFFFFLKKIKAELRLCSRALIALVIYEQFVRKFSPKESPFPLQASF